MHLDKKYPPCPYCNSQFGEARGSFAYGCTNSNCPEEPRYYDPIGRTDWIDEFWEEVQQKAPEVKRKKRQDLERLKELVSLYYND